MKSQMVRLVVLSFVFALSGVPSSVYAGHDFMGALQQMLTLTKEESCSGGRTKIEYRESKINGTQVSMSLVILVRDATGENHGFNNQVFYKISADGKTQHFLKEADSGNLTELTAVAWKQRLGAADANAAKALLNQPGSNCKVAP